jgi:hypothetical protein
VPNINFIKMKKLSRYEMKKVKGGLAEPSKKCSVNADCGTNVVTCGGDPWVVDGVCASDGTCRWQLHVKLLNSAKWL